MLTVSSISVSTASLLKRKPSIRLFPTIHLVHKLLSLVFPQLTSTFSSARTDTHNPDALVITSPVIAILFGLIFGDLGWDRR